MFVLKKLKLETIRYNLCKFGHAKDNKEILIFKYADKRSLYRQDFKGKVKGLTRFASW